MSKFLIAIFLVVIVGFIFLNKVSNNQSTSKNSSGNNNSDLNNNQEGNLTKGWVTFNSSEFNFKAKLPSEPTLEKTKYTVSKEFGDVTRYDYKSWTDSQILGIRVEILDFDWKIEDLNKLNDIQVNNALKESGGTLVSSKVSTFRSYPATEYVIKTEKNVYIFNKSFYKENIKYSFRQASASNSDTYLNELVNSFELTSTEVTN